MLGYFLHFSEEIASAARQLLNELRPSKLFSVLSLACVEVFWRPYLEVRPPLVLMIPGRFRE